VADNMHTSTLSGPAGKLIQDAWAFCRLFARVNARHFYYAFLFMPQEKRRAIHAVYAFCQKADQLVDLEPSAEAKLSRIKELRSDLQLVKRLVEYEHGKDKSETPPEIRDLILIGLADSLLRFPISFDLFESLLDGMEMDLSISQYDTFEDLERYCWHVASVVGLMVIEILGYKDDQVKDFAEKLGQAMQLTNMARDVLEDSLDGRVYLPQKLLEKHDYTNQDIANRVYDKRFVAIMGEFCNRADSLYELAFAVLPEADRANMKTSLMMANIYRPILQEIRRLDFNVYLGKCGYPIWRKIMLALKTLVWNK
jgi:15-cis-phytoene synthase